MKTKIERKKAWKQLFATLDKVKDRKPHRRKSERAEEEEIVAPRLNNRLSYKEDRSFFCYGGFGVCCCIRKDSIPIDRDVMQKAPTRIQASGR